jgi:hypothetical protein
VKKVLIVCDVNPNSNPRPNRMIRWLKDDFDVSVVSRIKFDMDGVTSYGYESNLVEIQPKNGTLTGLLQKIKIVPMIKTFLRFFNLLLKRYEEVNWQSLSGARALIPEIRAKHFDLIISHDLILLPFAFQVMGRNTKIMLDAREYYPLNFNDNWLWRITKKPVNQYLCNTYLERCDKVITVSPGLADEYHKEYGIKPEVVMSLPVLEDLIPRPPSADKIRIIHHGNASASRKIELMIEMMDHVDERFTLDLMMITKDPVYWNKIIKMAETRKNVRIIPPVAMQEIVTKINSYDVGLFLVPPTNFNLTYTLPNKLFEFIQARLVVAIGPSIDMKRIVEKYDCGIVSQDFQPQSLARELNGLTSGKIMALKKRSDQAARELNADMNRKKVHQMIEVLLSE